MYSHILLFLFFITSVSAQTGNPSEDVPITTLGTIHNDGDGIHIADEYCLNSDNDLIIRTNIILGGLQVEGTAPNYYGVIPSSYPDMYIEYTVNGTVYPPVQVGNFEIVELDNGFTAFSHIASSPAIDFSDDCANERESESFVFTTVKFRLVTPSDDGWDVYPACDYAESWNMFSCLVYDYAPWCEANNGLDSPTDPAPVCFDEWFSGGFSAFLYCDCRDDGPTKQDDPIAAAGDWMKDNNSDANYRVLEDAEVSIYPNPMDEILTIESGRDNIRAVQIYDSRGSLVQSKTYAAHETKNVHLNTSQLPHGLYLVRVSTDTGIKVRKVLK